MTDVQVAPGVRSGRVVPQGAIGLGLQLPVQAQSRLFAESWEHDAGVDDLVAVARAAEAAGVLYLAVCDHVAVPTDKVPTMGATWYEPFTTLAYLAAVTERVRLATHVAVLAVRHPLHAAKAAATLDHLSGGRLILGVGAGHVEDEFAALDAPFEGRGAVLDEAIDAVRAALSDEVPTHDGPRWSFRDVAVSPRPVQERVPIWVGGNSAPALRRVGQRGDGWLPQGTRLSELPAQVAAIEDAGGDPARLDLGATAPAWYLGTASWDLGRWSRSGSAQELAERIERYAEAGCSHVQLKLRARDRAELEDQLARVRDELVPAIEAHRPVAR